MRFRLNDEKVFSDVTDSIAILIDTESGIYYGLNALTTNVYENIVAGADTDELLAALKNVKGYTDDVENKFKAFLNALTDKGFISEDPGASAAVRVCFDEFTNDDLDFVLSEYPDASELLLADPIHQVREDMGWLPDREALK